VVFSIVHRHYAPTSAQNANLGGTDVPA
jgi:hypothetical protein